MVKKNPYHHLQDVRSKIYLCKDKHQHKRVQWAPTPPATSISQTPGRLGPRARVSDRSGLHSISITCAEREHNTAAGAAALTPRLEGQPAGGGSPGPPAPAARDTNRSPEGDAARLTPSSRPQALNGRPGAPWPPASLQLPQPLAAQQVPARRTRLRSARPSPSPKGTREARPAQAAPGREGRIPLGTPSQAGGPGTHPRPGGWLEGRERTWRRRSPQSALQGVS